MRVKSKVRLAVFLSLIFLSVPTKTNNQEFEYFDNTEFRQAYIEPVPTQSNLDRYLQDLDILARTIHAEAQGESYIGKLAVGTVIMNRVESEKFPNSIEGVVYAPGQFCVVRNGSINQEPSQESLDAAAEILAGRRVLDADVVYFYNPRTTQDKWIRTRQVASRHGNHNFAR